MSLLFLLKRITVHTPLYHMSVFTTTYSSVLRNRIEIDTETTRNTGLRVTNRKDPG